MYIKRLSSNNSMKHKLNPSFTNKNLQLINNLTCINTFIVRVHVSKNYELSICMQIFIDNDNCYRQIFSKVKNLN